MRKIVRISDSVVLCDDGTMWTFQGGTIKDGVFDGGEWVKFPDIPQDEDEMCPGLLGDPCDKKVYLKGFCLKHLRRQGIVWGESNNGR